jgi:AcrR family transcriptional regulator
MEMPDKGFGGQRERNKLDKLRRIKAAARDLFIAKGFDEATTREIASAAGVGVGTVFTYAQNKRDLLFLIANDELEEIAQAGEAGIDQLGEAGIDQLGEAGIDQLGEAGIDSAASCLDNLTRFFGLHYAFYGRQPVLSRMMLREMTFYDSGTQAARFQQIRERNIRNVGRIVALARDAGALRTREKPDFIGWIAFCIFQVELRRWLTTRESLPVGMAQLERALRAFMQGLDPAPAAFRRARPSRRGPARAKRRKSL